jgi:hypothetical protein
MMSLALALPVSAQTSGSQCEPPNFTITSNKSVLALAGESFSYYVVTENDTDYALSSQLPAGVQFQNGQLSGTPQTVGEYDITFAASDECGTTEQTVTLNVTSSESGNQVAQANDGTGNQSAAAGSQENVSLNEIPETGANADTALTVIFYALALLMLVGFVVRRLYFRYSFSGNANQKSGNSQKRVGNGLR